MSFILYKKFFAEHLLLQVSEETAKQQSFTQLNIDGGQFVAFVGDICYEADKKGIGVGHGTLKLNKSYSNSQFKYYLSSG